jgi:glycosyltransferase involved in cell wall biosynthesis
LAAHPRIDLTVYFCSRESLEAQDVLAMYKTNQPWGDEGELLQGYKHKFLRNFSPSPSYLNWPFGLINLGIWNELKREKPDAVIIMSWANVTWWLTILACSYYRIPFLYMTDANVQGELGGSRWKVWVKRVFLGKMLFRLTAGFLCAGAENEQLYRYYRVPDEKLFPFAYSWGYEMFFHVSEELRPQRDRIRAELGVPEKRCVILFCGRLSKEKSPLHLLEAYRRVALPHKALVFVGDGELRETLQDYVVRHNLDSVHFFGFQNRREIQKFYAISDLLVLPSRKETWGIVVNEAMCFGLPVIVSDQVGAGKDLVRHGYNGFGFAQGNVEELASTIERFMQLSEGERSAMGLRSLDLVKKWVQRDLAGSLVECLDVVCSRKAGKRGHGPL